MRLTLKYWLVTFWIFAQMFLSVALVGCGLVFLFRDHLIVGSALVFLAWPVLQMVSPERGVIYRYWRRVAAAWIDEPVSERNSA